MGMTAFDPDSSTNGMLETRGEAPKIQASASWDMAQAVADLLQHKSLTRTFGDQGEWEVRTTLVANRQAWRYQSSVFLHGKVAKKSFPSIDVDRTRQVRQTETVIQELLAEFAREAVEVHWARCESVKEYLIMASFFSQPLPRYYRTKKVALVLLSVAALLTAYWWWNGSNAVVPVQPDGLPPPHSLRWQPLQVAHHYPAGEPFEFPLPTLERIPEERPIEVALEASGDQPSWLQLDRERLHIHGTAPLTAANQTYRFVVRAHEPQGSDSRLVVLLTITDQPDRTTPVRQLPGHWSW
jgi:Putative Ig domain